MADQLIAGIPPVFDGNGAIASGGSVTFYETGTTTKVDIWADVAGITPLANPVFLDASGRPPNQVFYTGALAVKEVIKDAGGVIINTVDPSLRFSVSSAAAAGITYAPIESNAAVNVQDAINNVSTGLAAQTAANEGFRGYILKSADYTAAASQRVGADVSGGGFTITLPLAPVAGNLVIVSVFSGDVTVNNLTIAGNGKNVQGAATLVIDVGLATIFITYNGTEWRIG